MNHRIDWHKKLYLALFYLFARVTPRFWQMGQNRLVTPIVFRLWKGVQATLQNNLAVVLNRPAHDPLVRQTACRTLINYGLYLIDYAQLYRLDSRMLDEEEGAQHMRDALAAGKGAILVTPHLGNWELGGLVFAMRGHPIHALTLVDPETSVQDFRDQMRGSLGIETIHIDPDDFSTILRLAGLLRQNRIIAMLGDRFEGGKQVTVTFFGRQVIFPAGPAALALATGAPIIPVYTLVKPDGRYKAVMDAPIHVQRSGPGKTIDILTDHTQQVAAAFERTIRCYPDQWYHFFDYWGRYGC
jgi:KDO2-lipid IV(A) lauroyltransferase